MADAAYPVPADDLGYADALAELESILRGLEGDDLDVDALAGKVRRAGELIARCRSRIQDARLEVDQVVADLGDEVGGPD